MAKRELDAVPLTRFGVIVAQLESIATSAPQQPPDALLCFDLLSELVVAIDEESKGSILQWQRKCEDALHSLLVLGARRPVRRLASVAMVKVIAKGDGISIYSRASSLQGWLADGRRSEPLACAGGALCLGELYNLFGRRITSSLVESTNIVSKLMKYHEDFVRQDTLQMLENALEGSGGNGVSTAYLEAFRVVMRMGVNDKSHIVRLAAARCLRTFAGIGGPGLGIIELESAIAYSLKALEDPVSSVRDAFSEALGALLALTLCPEELVKHRGKGVPVLVQKLEDSIQKNLVVPFIKASGIRAKDLRVGVALSWVHFLQAFRLKYLLPDTELQSFAIQAMNMLQGNNFVDAQALACVLYILRVGVTDQMSEPTQRSFLVHLAKQIESPGYSPMVGVATLRVLSYLLVTLGEVPGEFKLVLDNTVVAALSHSSLHVRIEAALTVRALAEVDPTCVGGLIAYGVTTLNALRESAAVGMGNSALNLELDSLHGQAIVLAALVSISPKLALGYPMRLPKSVFAVSKKMLTDFSRFPLVASVEKESGWLLLASLLSAMPKEELDDVAFDILLLWASSFVGDPEFHISRMQDMTSEIRVLSAAIEALTAFIRSFISSTGEANNKALFLQPVVAYLSGALSYVSSFAAMQLPNLEVALELFTIRILMAYQALSDPMAYRSEHPQIIQICTTPFSEPSKAEESSCLRFLLDKRDACLGPWIPGRDWYEDELRAYDGQKDGILPCVWDDNHTSFPQLGEISKVLINQKLLCFGTIFASQDNNTKHQLLNMIEHCIRTGRRQSWHVPSVTNVCVALLSALKALLHLRPQTLDIDILSSIQTIFLGIIGEGEICSAQRRASCEGLGLLARLGSDVFTARMTRSLLADLSLTSETNYAGSLAFSLGCIHRCAGGMALSTLVPATVSSISALAKNFSPGLQLWSLHALLLTIEAAGLSCITQVQGTLFLALDVLLSEESGLVDLRQEIGRLVNAIVAVLGPELSPGSTFFSRCKSVIAEISACRETSTLLESVRFTQQLVLFAPHAVSVHYHTQNLLPTLFSRQPSLRYIAVSTLRHLIEKDPVAMIDEHIEEQLFNALDVETDSGIASLLRGTITCLLYTSCPSCPSRWLEVLHDVILSTSARKNVEYHAGHENKHPSASEGNYRLYYGEDDEDMIDDAGKKQRQSVISINRRESLLRYRTRVFAAECLSHLPEAVGAHPAHFDVPLSGTQSSKGHSETGDWLILHLQDMISLSYQISTGHLEGMQPIGLKILSIIMDKFGKTPDQELPGHLLLEQYQAQLVSAVRSSITTTSSPLLLEAGLQLATKVLTSSILCGDRLVLSRIFSLISHSLSDIQDLYYPSFAEWVACKIKVRLLAALASIKCYVYSFLNKQDCSSDENLQLIPQFSSSSSILGKYWISVLKDYCYIFFRFQSKTTYIPFLDGIQSPMVSAKVQECLDEARPLILQAVVLDAAPTEYELSITSQFNIEYPSENVFLSGNAMVKLDFRDFQFLWGLTLFDLFQQQQSVANKKSEALCTHLYKETTCDSLLLGSSLLFETPLIVLKSMSTKAFFNHEFLALDWCREIIQVLTYVNFTDRLTKFLVICILEQTVLFCPDEFFEFEEFTDSVTELCVKYLCITFQCEKSVENDHYEKTLLSKLTMTAECIVLRTHHKNNSKALLSIISVCYECFKGASSDVVIPRIITFLWSILPSLKKSFQVDPECDLEIYNHVMVLLGAWASMLLFMSKDCTSRIHDVENDRSYLFKLLAKVLASCLEEAVALAILARTFQDFRQKRNHITLVAVQRCCIRCIQEIFYSKDLKVQAAGIHTLRILAQRELSTGMQPFPFFLFFIGELFEDIFLLIHGVLKPDKTGGEFLVIIEECLNLLFLVHTHTQKSSYCQPVTRLLLEALVVVFFSGNSNEKEISQVRNIVMKLVAHVIKIHSSAAVIRDVMLSMPVAQRQQIQEILRSSITLSQVNAMSSGEPLIGKLHVQETNSVLDREHYDLDYTSEDAVKPGPTQEIDEDDDWDAYQSLPANTKSSPSMSTPHDDSEDKTETGNVCLVIENPHIQVSEEASDGKSLDMNNEMEIANHYIDGLNEHEYTIDSDAKLYDPYRPDGDAAIIKRKICGSTEEPHDLHEQKEPIEQLADPTADQMRSVNSSEDEPKGLSSDDNAIEDRETTGTDEGLPYSSQSKEEIVTLSYHFSAEGTSNGVNGHLSNVADIVPSSNLQTEMGEGPNNEQQAALRKSETNIPQVLLEISESGSQQAEVGILEIKTQNGDEVGTPDTGASKVDPQK